MAKYDFPEEFPDGGQSSGDVITFSVLTGKMELNPREYHRFGELVSPTADSASLPAETPRLTLSEWMRGIDRKSWWLGYVLGCSATGFACAAVLMLWIMP